MDITQDIIKTAIAFTIIESVFVIIFFLGIKFNSWIEQMDIPYWIKTILAAPIGMAAIMGIAWSVVIVFVWFAAIMNWLLQ